MRKVLICRPRGGVNDCLCQVERSRIYAEKFSRELWVDSLYSEGIGSRFWDVFREKKSAGHDGFDVAFGRDNLESFYTGAGGNEIDLDTWRDATNLFGSRLGSSFYCPGVFDYSMDYEAPIVFHEKFGGGNLGFYFLSRVVLTPRLVEIVQPDIPFSSSKTYSAVHIRNTDYKTDLFPFLRFVKKRVRHGNLFLCTDSMDALEAAKSFFFRSNVSLKYAPSARADGETPLHYGVPYLKSEERFRRLAASFLDLFRMALSRRLFIATLRSGNISGFSHLAESMFLNKWLVEHLLSDRESGEELLGWEVRWPSRNVSIYSKTPLRTSYRRYRRVAPSVINRVISASTKK